jgi:hypothetical protein
VPRARSSCSADLRTLPSCLKSPAILSKFTADSLARVEDYSNPYFGRAKRGEILGRSICLMSAHPGEGWRF